MGPLAILLNDFILIHLDLGRENLTPPDQGTWGAMHGLA